MNKSSLDFFNLIYYSYSKNDNILMIRLMNTLLRMQEQWHRARGCAYRTTPATVIFLLEGEAVAIAFADKFQRWHNPCSSF